jgi:hypothetical protein
MRGTWMMVAVALTAGCDGIELEQLVKQYVPSIRYVPEQAGAHCPQGGQQVQTGLDRDEDGVLDDAEVTASEYRCFTVRTRIRPEPAGAQCERGGQAVLSGLDADANGTLDDAEVTGTEYVCATAVPGLLLRTRTVLPGDGCPLGGKVSHAGHDTDGDHYLDDEEITHEVYSCTEVELVRTRLSVRPFFPFDGCGTDGTTVTAGVDRDHNGELEDGEVRGEASACININRARLLQRPEPPGAACATGGTFVGLGEDSDGNGAFEETEVKARLYICEPTLAFQGDYRVDDPADLEPLRGVSHIRGTLTLEGEALTEVVLPGLVVVEGALRIEHAPALKRVELANLRNVGRELYIANNAELETLVVGSANTEQTLWVGTQLTLHANGKLRTLSGLASVAPQASFNLNDNPLLEEPGDLRNISQLSGGVSIQRNASLKRVPLPHLQTTHGSVQVLENASLTSISGLSSLTSVGGDLDISSNPSLTSLSGLHVQYVRGTLSIALNPLLQVLGGLPLRQVGSLSITSNDALQRVGPLPMLEFVQDTFVLHNNTALSSIDRLPLLRQVKRLAIIDCPLLTGLDAFAHVAWAEELHLRDNRGLVSLAGLSGLRELGTLFLRRSAALTSLGLDRLERVTTGFYVGDNPMLPSCLASALADAVYTGPPEARSISRNDDEATCAR